MKRREGILWIFNAAHEKCSISHFSTIWTGKLLLQDTTVQVMGWWETMGGWGRRGGGAESSGERSGVIRFPAHSEWFECQRLFVDDSSASILLGVCYSPRKPVRTYLTPPFPPHKHPLPPSHRSHRASLTGLQTADGSRSALWNGKISCQDRKSLHIRSRWLYMTSFSALVRRQSGSGVGGEGAACRWRQETTFAWSSPTSSCFLHCSSLPPDSCVPYHVRVRGMHLHEDACCSSERRHRSSEKRWASPEER